ncbi:hypothetical protein D1227_11475 [Henriciella mobilis]|nr:hypothetical protein D1231_18890 [Henriciella mobilis]RIJ20932.1 hypothetical protein D1227_11475 [Henriciella mobilis]
MSLVRGEICTSMTRRMLYRFEDFEIDSGSMRLFRSGEPVAAEPQVIMLLLLLVRKHGETVTKAEINDAVWDGRIVSASALTSRLRAARAAIDDDGSSQRLIRTIPNIGLRFVGNVETVSTGAPSSPGADWLSWPMRWASRRPRLLAGLAAALLATGSGIYLWLQPPHALRSQFEVTYNAAISGHNTRPLTFLSLKGCMTACLEETEFYCKSFDFSSIRKTCDLSNASAKDVGGLKTDYYRNPYDHYARKPSDGQEQQSAPRQ